MKKLLLFLFQLFLIATANGAIEPDSMAIIQSVKFHEGEIDFPLKQTSAIATNLFTPYKGKKLKIDRIYWFQIIINNKNANFEDYFIHFNSKISNINLYKFVNDSIYVTKKSGAFVALSQKEFGGYLKDKVLFSLLPNKLNVLYIRIYNQLENNYSLNKIEIVSQAEFEKSLSDINFLQGGFLGMMAIIITLNFFLFIFSRDKLYMYYSLYILFTAIFFFNNFQYSERYFFFNLPKWDLSLLWSVYIGQLVYLFFLLELLKNEHIPLWRKYVKYYAWFLLVFCSIILVTGQINYYVALIISDLYTLTNVIFVIGSFFIFYKRVTLTTKMVLTGSLIMVIGAFITTIKDFSVISVNNLFYYQLGVFVELILFTLAINYTYTKEHIERLHILYKNSVLELEKNQKDNENKMLLDEVASKNRVLATKALILSEKETLIAGLIQQFRQIDTNSKNRSAIQNIVNNLKINLSNNSWLEFEKHFNEVHTQFYSILGTKYPDLTANDRKLCAFLKLNLSTKEIALITGKTLNTIDVGRSRLRKKIGLTNEENLHTIIANIG